MSVKKIAVRSAAIVAAGWFLVENRQLKVSEYKVSCPKLPESFDGKKILLLSDLHKKRYGDNFNNLMNSVIAAEPDYIFFAGDLYSKDEKDMTPKLALMRRLNNTAPLYYVLGNHEIRNMDNCEALCCKLEKIGVNVLRNEKFRLYCGNDFVNIYGTQLPISCYINRDGSYRNLRQITPEYMEKLLGKADKSSCNILISHNPFFFESYAKWGADMVFSGHCHGGIIRLPFIGGILSPERIFFPKYTKGVYTSENKVSKMILTAGLGKFRVNNPSEIVVCTLERWD